MGIEILSVPGAAWMKSNENSAVHFHPHGYQGTRQRYCTLFNLSLDYKYEKCLFAKSAAKDTFPTTQFILEKILDNWDEKYWPARIGLARPGFW